MIIDRFGSLYSTAFQLPSLQAEDDWQSVRPPVTARVGGAGGAFDFYGSANAPIEAIAVKKAFTITGSGVPVTGTGTIAATLGDNTVTGTGTRFLSELAAGVRIYTGTGIHLQSFVVDTITDDEHFESVAPAFEDTTGASYTIVLGSIWSVLDLAIDEIKRRTLALGETKLWGLLRDGRLRWAWAKCTGVTAPEKYGNKLAMPGEIDFYLREGLWYGETEQALTIADETSPYTFTLTNSGNAPAYLKATLTNNAVDALTLPKLENLTNGLEWTFDQAGTTDDVVEDGVLIVDAAAHSVTYNDPGVGHETGAYASLTLPATQVVFMQLEPGVNSMRFSATITGTPDYDLVLAWWDTYL